jgi:hypothetical protein
MLRAKETFHVGTADGTRTFAEGDLVDAAPKGCEAFFEPAEDEPKTTKKTQARRAPAAKQRQAEGDAGETKS